MTKLIQVKFLKYWFSGNRKFKHALSLLSENGRIVHELMDKDQTSGVYSFDLKNVDLASGNYFWKIQTEGFVKLIKVIKF